MGYDRLVDSAKHDAALTATADAIRNKTGGSGKVAWDATKGFADAIASLSKVASGTIRMTYSSGDNVTISGLGFKPSTVILFALPNSDYDYELEAYCLYAIFDGSGTKSYYGWASYDENEYEDENGESYTDISSYMVISTSGDLQITAKNDGFVVNSIDTSWSGVLSRSHSYKYYAF